MLILLFLSLIERSTSAQQPDLKDTLDIHIQKGMLTEALQQISNITGIRFAYRSSVLKDKNVNPASYNLPLQEILNKLLTDNRLCFTVLQNQIIINTGCFPKYITVTGTVFRDSTLEPVPYVAVSVLNKTTGIIADHSGHFEINIPWSADELDTLVFSSMGYLRDTLIFNPLKNNVLSIYLNTKYYPIEPLEILPRKYEIVEIGNTRDRISGSLYLDTHGQQTALYINNKRNKTGILKSVSYFISDDGNTDAPFRVRIYAVDTNNLPGRDLVEDAVVVKPETGAGWFSVDIEKLKIEVPPEGIFIAIEGVFPDDYENYYGDTEFIDLRHQNNRNNNSSLTYGQRIGYNRKCRKETWHYSMSKVWFQLEKQSFGVMIAAVVKYVKINEQEKDIKND